MLLTTADTAAAGRRTTMHAVRESPRSATLAETIPPPVDDRLRRAQILRSEAAVTDLRDAVGWARLTARAHAGLEVPRCG